MLAHYAKGFGEVVLRIKDMEKMTHFYEKVMGFELMRYSEAYTFFKVADGYGGHTQIIGLFASTNPTPFSERKDTPNVATSTMHHLAFEMDVKEYDSLLKKLEEMRIDFKTESFAWVQWKSAFFQDPEGNVLEFVCFDKSIEKA